MSLLIIGEILIIVILATIAGLGLVVAISVTQVIGTFVRRNKFDWAYNKLLYSYKIKVLTDELRKRKVSMEELYEIMHDALESKKNKKHVLDQVEEEVKGDVEEVKPVKQVN